MNTHRNNRRAFTLVELLVVIAILGVLTTLLVPVIDGALESARTVQCLTNLRYVGSAVGEYRKDHRGQFPPYRAAYTEEYMGVPANTYLYYWGSATNPVNRRASWMYDYWDFHCLLCPSLNWNDLVPQAGIIEPTTAYGYNAQKLDPAFMGRVGPVGTTVASVTMDAIARPPDLTLFADTALFWSPGGVPILQNSTYLEHPVPPAGWTVTPTNHFRHEGRCNTVSASGYASSRLPGDGALLQPERNLGFLSLINEPNYK